MGSEDQSEGIEATRVDLGDDLLEKTVIVTRPESGSRDPPVTPPPVQVTDPSDAFESARILFSEGFLDEAKQLLRKILIADSSHLGARDKLAEIHELELKQILEGRENIRPRLARSEPVQPLLPLSIDSSEVAQALERDLGLGSELELLGNLAQGESYVREVLGLLRGAEPRDFLDLGIAFLELGLFDVAARLLAHAAEHSDDIRVEASLVQVQALLSGGRPSEAELVVDDLIARSGGLSDPLVQLEIRYWKARLLEVRGHSAEALAWYREAFGIDPTHRDLVDRLRRMALR